MTKGSRLTQLLAAFLRASRHFVAHSLGKHKLRLLHYKWELADAYAALGAVEDRT